MRYLPNGMKKWESRLSGGGDEQIRLLREILKWIRFSGMTEVRALLEKTLDDPQKLLAYHLSDGTRGSVEISKITGIKSTGTVTKYWQTWQKQSLGENVPVQGGVRFKRFFDVEELGLTVPDAPTIGRAKRG